MMGRGTVLVVLLLLTACAGGPATIGHLTVPPPPPSRPSPPDLDAAIAAYRAYLADADPTHRGYDAALERLAQLELARGRDRQGSSPHSPDELTTAPQGDTRAAVRRLRHLTERHPDDPRLPWWLYQLARAHLELGEQRPALAALDRLVRRAPRHALAPEAQFRRAEILFAQGRYRQAEVAYRAVLSSSAREFHPRARYKLAWSELKQDRPQAALEAFLILYREWGLDDDSPPLVDAAARALHQDLRRGIHRALDALGGPATLDRLLSEGTLRHPERLYESLGDDYLARERYLDAARSYLALGERRPRDLHGARLALRALEAQRRAGLLRAARDLAHTLAERYARPELWADADEDLRETTLPAYLSLVEGLARRHHARAQRLTVPRRVQAERRRAIRWYRNWLALAPPDHPHAVEQGFLLAELLEADGRLQEAAEVFHRIAYRHPDHPRAAEAAYAAVLIHTRRLRAGKEAGDRRLAWKREVDAFLVTFPDHPQSPRVLAERILVRLEEGEDVERLARRVLAHPGRIPAVYPALIAAALGDRAFAAGDYPRAADDYQQALEALGRLPAPLPTGQARGPAPPDGIRLQRRLALSHYRAARELAERATQDPDALNAALKHYRAAAAREAGEIAQAARRDALAVLIEQRRWRAAWDWLKSFPPPAGPQRLASRALILEHLERPLEAARHYQRLADTTSDPALARDARLKAARLYSRAERPRQAVAQYKAYLYRHNPPLLLAQQARWALVELYQTLGEEKKRRFWLERLVRAAERHPEQEALRPLAGRAALQLAGEAARHYRAAIIKPPLKHRLRTKKKRFQRALEAYARATRLEVAEVVTRATYESAELHADFAQALLHAPVPANLSGEALESYRLQVEELAYPFEERAIALHQANTRRAREGLYDRWVQASYRRLAELLPVRYAKREEVDRYDERLP